MTDNKEAIRAEFEEIISSSPYERSVDRFPDDDTSAWPGSYRDISVDLAWCVNRDLAGRASAQKEDRLAESTSQSQKEIRDAALEEAAQIVEDEAFPSERARFGVAADTIRALKSTPTAPQDICRKCSGQMKPGKAIAQTVTGIPDFPSDKHPVTVSPDGPGVLIDCLKCEDCGWSVTAPQEISEFQHSAAAQFARSIGLAPQGAPVEGGENHE